MGFIYRRNYMRRNVKSALGRKYVQVASCTGNRVRFALPKTERMKVMEELQIDKKMCLFRNIAGILSILIMFTSCSVNAQKNQNFDEAHVSWKIYCEKYEVDTCMPTEEEYNWYLDCYSGSIEEETDVLNYANY